MSTSEPQAGDFAVVRSPHPGWQGRAIMWGTRSHWHHAVGFLSPTTVISAQPGGAVIEPWANYAGWQTLTSAGIPELALTDEQRTIAAIFGRDFQGIPYGWVTIATITALQWHLRPRLLREYVEHSSDRMCSQLVDSWRQRCGSHLYDDGRSPGDVSPGDLGELLGAR